MGFLRPFDRTIQRGGGVPATGGDGATGGGGDGDGDRGGGDDGGEFSVLGGGVGNKSFTAVVVPGLDVLSALSSFWIIGERPALTG